MQRLRIDAKDRFGVATEDNTIILEITVDGINEIRELYKDQFTTHINPIRAFSFYMIEKTMIDKLMDEHKLTPKSIKEALDLRYNVHHIEHIVRDAVVNKEVLERISKEAIKEYDLEAEPDINIDIDDLGRNTTLVRINVVKGLSIELEDRKIEHIAFLSSIDALSYYVSKKIVEKFIPDPEWKELIVFSKTTTKPILEEQIYKYSLGDRFYKALVKGER